MPAKKAPGTGPLLSSCPSAVVIALHPAATPTKAATTDAAPKRYTRLAVAVFWHLILLWHSISESTTPSDSTSADVSRRRVGCTLPLLTPPPQAKLARAARFGISTATLNEQKEVRAKRFGPYQRTLAFHACSNMFTAGIEKQAKAKAEDPAKKAARAERFGLADNGGAKRPVRLQRRGGSARAVPDGCLLACSRRVKASLV